MKGGGGGGGGPPGKQRCIGMLREKLALVWEVAVDKEAKAKDKMVRRAEPHVKERHFSPGDQVLVRVVDPGGKLGDRWSLRGG